MQTRFHFGRSPLAAGAFCLTLAAALTGCASKNPLMEEPAPMARKKAEPVKEEETATAAAPVAEEKAAVQTTATPASAPAPQEASAAETARTVIEATPESAPAVDKNAAPAPAPTAVTASTVASTPATASVPSTATETASNPAPEAAAAASASTTTSVQTVRPKRFLGFLRPYRPDIQQGNFVSREMVAQLKPGMTQDQVTFLLGTPLLNDIFHADRWDYAFRLQKGNGEITTSRVTVHFKDGLVTSYEGGGDLPTEADYLARIANKAKEAKK